MGSRDHIATCGLEENEPDEVAVSGCFDFRLRTRSFDLHHIAQNRKLKKLALHMRSESDTDIVGANTKASSAKSLKNSTQLSSTTSRRFVRVVRDSRNPDIENPHVIHRFSEHYVQQLNTERACNSFSEGVKPLPYLVTGHTILKKQATVDRSEFDLPESPSVFKRAKFFDEVVVIEFDKERTICKAVNVTHREKLHDEVDGQIETLNHLVSGMIIQAEEGDDRLETEVPVNGDDRPSTDTEVFLPSEST